KINPKPNLKIRPNKTNFLELRSKNLVASDVAAVDEPRYTHHQQNRQQANSKKIQKTQNSFTNTIYRNENKD
ncbi:hypothetical protein, partial [Roseibium sp.]|uniref:hypothetical protein n=1 Tax=Roseibium sp. TaxID=1936156 RepID=UPI0025F9F726